MLSGFGFSLTAIPLLTLVCSRKDAVVSSTLVGLVSQTAMAWQLRREIERDAIRWALPASIVGMPLGIVVGHLVSERAMRIGVGVAVLVAVASMVRGATLRGRPRVIDTCAGVISGVLATTTGTNGPPLVIAFAGRNLTPGVTRATLSTMFAIANVVAFALFALDRSVSTRVPALAAVGLVDRKSVV